MNKTTVAAKIRESAVSVMPIVAIVLIICLAFLPVRPDLLLSFLLGTMLIILGMSLFSLGAETSMTPIGSQVGTAITKTKNLPFVLAVSFALGFAVTVAEPDLQVLAETVPGVSNTVLLLTVGLGVGFFLMICMLRIITGMKLKWLLVLFYTALFVLAFFADSGYLAVAFDSGGVTTGPMTVPFILALGVGVSNIRSDKNAAADSFGLVALSSIGPIITVLVLSFFYPAENVPSGIEAQYYSSTSQIGSAYAEALPVYMREMLAALLPVIVIFVLFQIFSLKMSLRNLAKIGIGILYTYVGLVLFLTGVNVGFSSLGSVLGSEIAQSGSKYILIPLAMLLGWFIISAEPAVIVLEKQIEDVSAGAIPKSAIKISLSIAISLAMGLSMLRMITGVSILWFLVPGYALALILSVFVPDIYTAIAFDSGGVASGPMTATFMLRFFMGACTALGGNVMRDAFGVVAMVSLMPLISIQTVGLIFDRKKKVSEKPEVYGDDEIVELWEEVSA